MTTDKTRHLNDMTPTAVMDNLMSDKGTIISTWSDAPDETGASVGHDGVTKIVPYEERGQMSNVVWFAVYKGDIIWKRLNAALMAEVRYQG